jgi:hypothetical protein
VAPVYEDGEKTVTLKGSHIAEEFQAMVERYIERTYPPLAPAELAASAAAAAPNAEAAVSS